MSRVGDAGLEEAGVSEGDVFREECFSIVAFRRSMEEDDDLRRDLEGIGGLVEVFVVVEVDSMITSCGFVAKGH